MSVVYKQSVGQTFKVLDPTSYPYGDNTFEDEEDVKCGFLHDLTPEDLLVDVGAAWGGYALPALAKGAAVLAFDATEDSERILVGNAALNAWEHRLAFRRYALWDGTDDYPAWMQREIFGVRYPTGAPPRVVALDRVLSELGDAWRVGRRVTRVKVDVEGAELGVLRGMVEMLRRDRPRLLIESHVGIYPDCTRESSAVPILALLIEVGYSDVKEEWWGDRPGGRSFITAPGGFSFRDLEAQLARTTEACQNLQEAFDRTVESIAAKKP